MKILWISFLGSWTEPLLRELSQLPQLKIGIIIPYSKNLINLNQFENIDVFYLKLAESEMNCEMTNQIYLKYKKIFDQFNPNLIHIHGTEKNLAQIENYFKSIPVIISIQGILSGYKQYDLNYLKRNDYQKFYSIKNILGRGGVLEMGRVFNNSQKYEPNILENGNYFIGRTNWDKAHILFRNPHANYYHCEELLRNPFYNLANSWKIENCEKFSIFMPSGFNPIKGLHWAIDSVALLKKFYPNVKLIVPGMPTRLLKHKSFIDFVIGENFVRYIKAKIKLLKLEENIIFTPNLTDTEMAMMMKTAHVFLSPTSIDNSPNSVGEAMMIGTPIVITPVGGITSFLTDNVNCLLAPAGDSYMMAYQIKNIFDNEVLALNLSSEAHKVALNRHSKQETVKQYLSAYKDAIKIHSLNHKSY